MRNLQPGAARHIAVPAVQAIRRRYRVGTGLSHLCDTLCGHPAYPERAYAKWLVLHAMWGHMRRVLDGRLAKEAFREAWEKSTSLIERPLYLANDRMFRAALQFYRARRGRGARALDPSSFFKRKNLHREFDRFWRGSGNSHRRTFGRVWNRFRRELKQAAEART